jgi:uncharacterized protein (AIM24 family)
MWKLFKNYCRLFNIFIYKLTIFKNIYLLFFCFKGETWCKSILKNTGNKEAYLGITPNFPAKVIPVKLSDSDKFIGKSGAYMSSIGDISVAADFDCCSLGGCFGGLGLVRQSLTGNGTVFLAAGGTVITKTLDINETVIVDSNSVVGFDDTVQFSVNFSGGPLFCLFGGEGCFNNTMTGPGQVILQSMSFSTYVAAVRPVDQGEAGSE